MKVVEDCANSLEIRNNIQPSRYFRSSLKIVRMAGEYLVEGRMEKAYILYRRLIMYFKKLHHPYFASVSLSDRVLSNRKLREVVPKAQKLKTRRLEQYTHKYKHYEEQHKLKQKREIM
jgi:STAM-binding protein